MVYNYKRVSTYEQNTARQLVNINCDIEFEDKASGKSSDREQLQLLLKIVRSGDTVNVHSMDRLARNTQNMLAIVKDITSRGASLVFHTESLNFNSDDDALSQLMLTMLSAFSEFERNMILSRQREGIAIAKTKGKYKGRKSKLTTEQLDEMKVDFSSGMKKTEIAKKFDITRSYVYQLVV